MELAWDACLNFSIGFMCGFVFGMGEKLIQDVKNSILMVALIRVLTGAFVSMLNKYIEHLKIPRTDKGFLVISAFDGGLTGLTALISAQIGKHFTSLIVKSGINVIISGVGAGISNLFIQYVKVKAHNQTNYDIRKFIQTISSNVSKRGIREILKLLSTFLFVSTSGERRGERYEQRQFLASNYSEEEEVFENDESMVDSMMFSLL
jgi:predicted PurR-regulated permease PerM